MRQLLSKPSSAKPGQHLYAFCRQGTNQVLYTFNRALAPTDLKQLPDIGANHTPPSLRRDQWRPLWTVTMPDTRSGHLLGQHLFKKLREYRRLHELCWQPPAKLSQNYTEEEIEQIKKTLEERGGSKRENAYDVIKKKKMDMRARMVMDQKANSIADLAAALLEQLREGMKQQTQGITEESRRQQEVEEMLRLAEDWAKNDVPARIAAQIAQIESEMVPEEAPYKKVRADLVERNAPRRDLIEELKVEQSKIEFAYQAVERLRAPQRRDEILRLKAEISEFTNPVDALEKSLKVERAGGRDTAGLESKLQDARNLCREQLSRLCLQHERWYSLKPAKAKESTTQEEIANAQRRVEEILAQGGAAGGVAGSESQAAHTLGSSHVTEDNELSKAQEKLARLRCQSLGINHEPGHAYERLRTCYEEPPQALRDEVAAQAEPLPSPEDLPAFPAQFEKRHRAIVRRARRQAARAALSAKTPKQDKYTERRAKKAEIEQKPQKALLRQALVDAQEKVFTTEGVTIQWSNVFDAELAESWPDNLTHLPMGYHGRIPPAVPGSRPSKKKGGVVYYPHGHPLRDAASEDVGTYKAARYDGRSRPEWADEENIGDWQRIAGLERARMEKIEGIVPAPIPVEGVQAIADASQAMLDSTSSLDDRFFEKDVKEDSEKSSQDFLSVEDQATREKRMVRIRNEILGQVLARKGASKQGRAAVSSSSEEMSPEYVAAMEQSRNVEDVARP